MSISINSGMCPYNFVSSYLHASTEKAVAILRGYTGSPGSSLVAYAIKYSNLMLSVNHILLRPYQGFCGTGGNGISLGNKDNIGEQGTFIYKITIFRFLGNLGTSQFISSKPIYFRGIIK